MQDNFHACFEEEWYMLKPNGSILEEKEEKNQNCYGIVLNLQNSICVKTALSQHV